MTTPKPEVKPAWAQFEADMKALRDELRRHYEPAPSGNPDLQSALNKLGKAADEVFDSLGRATRDPEVRDGTRKARRSPRRSGTSPTKWRLRSGGVMPHTRDPGVILRCSFPDRFRRLVLW